MPHHGQYQHVKEWLRDHDTDVVNESPPVQNDWYEVFHAQDVRLLSCRLWQTNDETNAKDIEIRWIIDGNPYLESTTLGNATARFIYRTQSPSSGGTGGLGASAAQVNAAWSVDKRGLDFKVEVRMTSVPGTNQSLICWCVRETLEVT